MSGGYGGGAVKRERAHGGVLESCPAGAPVKKEEGEAVAARARGEGGARATAMMSLGLKGRVAGGGKAEWAGRERPGEPAGAQKPKQKSNGRGGRTNQDEFAEVLNPLRQSIIYLGWILMMAVGHLRDFLDSVGAAVLPRRAAQGGGGVDGAGAIVSDAQDFYSRRLYMRIVDIFNRPISSAPGSWIDVMERERRGDPCRTHPTCTGRTIRCLNLGSYNYLGLGGHDAYCTPKVIRALRDCGPSTCSPSAMGGTVDKHAAMDAIVARFLGCESAFVYGMGFATNAFTIPLLAGKGTLIISDEFNHKSIVDGVRLSGASVKVFKHNNVAHLEWLLRQAIVQGHPRTHRPWRKIVIIVEGIYSMEGEMVKLREIVALKKKCVCFTPSVVPFGVPFPLSPSLPRGRAPRLPLALFPLIPIEMRRRRNDKEKTIDS